MLPKLDESEVRELIDIRDWANVADYETRQREIYTREASLSPSVRQWWFSATVEQQSAELRRWRPAYRVSRVGRGYLVYPWLKSAGRYRQRPERLLVPVAEIDQYKRLIRVPTKFARCVHTR